MKNESAEFLAAATDAMKGLDDSGGSGRVLDYGARSIKELRQMAHDLEMKIGFAERAYQNGVGKVSETITRRTLRDTAEMVRDLRQIQDYIKASSARVA